MIVGCLYLEIEGQSWLVGSVDRGLMKIDQLGRLAKKEVTQILINRIFPIAKVLEIFQQTIKKHAW